MPAIPPPSTGSCPRDGAPGEIQWPTPKRLPVGPLMDYGYEGKLWLLSKITAPANAKAGERVTLQANGGLAGGASASAFPKNRRSASR